MHLTRGKLGVFPVVLFGFSALAIAAGSKASTTAPPLVNWSAPAAYTPPTSSSRIRALGDISNPVPFIGISPCRQYNSTSPPSPLLQGVNRTVTLTGIPCGIPASAVAVSVNITVFNITSATGNGVFKVDTVSPPAVAWINYPPAEAQRGNAGVVALNGGQIVVQVAQGAGQVDFIVDVNGYYPDTRFGPLGLNEFFEIRGSASGNGVIIGLNSLANGIGVEGVADASSGHNYGVLGYCPIPLNDSAGVYGSGVAISGLNAYDFAGVRGEAGTHTGVLGVSRFQGIAGSVVNTSGIEQAYGVLGFNPGSVYAVFAGGAIGGTGAKFFVEPHPTDASKVIRYVSLEGPESGTYFRGRGKFQNGVATIEVPEDFRMVTDSEGLSIQVTPIGELATVAVVRIALDEIVVKASRNVEFFYTVNGVRRTHKDLRPIGPGKEFAPRSADARMPAYLTEGQKALLISNGTYREDGTVNLETAERVGWTRMWADRDARAKDPATEVERNAVKR